MLQDPFFWAFIATTLILGWVWGRLRHLAEPLYESIAQLRLERDAQARTIQWQRKVIAELENEKGKNKLGAFRGAFAKQREEGSNQ